MPALTAAEFEQSVVPWIGKTGKLMHAFMSEKFKQHVISLSVEQFVILRLLHETDGRPQNDMALVTDRHKASLTRLLDNMENNHLVTRITDPDDKRVNRIHLTKHGKAVFQQTLPVIKEGIDEIQQGLSEQEIKTLIAILTKVQTNIHFP